MLLPHMLGSRDEPRPYIRELASQMRRRPAPFRRAQFRLEGRLQKSWDEHDRIVQSILARDIAAAGSASRDH
ncbi:hypothetical protein MSC49_37830 (plasmid) [Methylosinus sp. C49]|nr:hypothetical protein MSC49_37830 [Methylosinus sp. C49]